MIEDTSQPIPSRDQHFYGQGKLLISGEYFVLDGAKALALPLIVGQSLSVKYKSSFSPALHWKSLDVDGKVWFETQFEFWHFDCLDKEPPSDIVLTLQKILREARKQNPHFLRDEVDVYVETKLGFPLGWGLGSSSTLVYNIAQWAYVSPFELLFKTFGGSGYDIACAQSRSPIIYERKNDGPHWEMSRFDPPFKENLYFVYLGRKQCSKAGVKDYTQKGPYPAELIANLSRITEDMLKTNSLEEFNFLIKGHEELISRGLSLPRAKELHFADYWGEIKSLGAWGGDFILVTSDKHKDITREYFQNKGYDVFFPYKDLVIESDMSILGVKDEQPTFIQ